jgi:rhodanese-related sulfurtransferase
VDVPEVDIATFAERQAEGAPVVDVREPDEYEGGHVPGATLIPLGEVADRADEVPSDGTVYLICARGGRSMKAAEHLAGLGRDVVNVGGGTMAWVDAGHPTVSGPDPR